MAGELDDEQIRAAPGRAGILRLWIGGAMLAIGAVLLIVGEVYGDVADKVRLDAKYRQGSSRRGTDGEGWATHAVEAVGIKGTLRISGILLTLGGFRLVRSGAGFGRWRRVGAPGG